MAEPIEPERKLLLQDAGFQHFALPFHFRHPRLGAGRQDAPLDGCRPVGFLPVYGSLIGSDQPRILAQHTQPGACGYIHGKTACTTRQF